MEPYYRDESCTLYLGDCLEVLPQLDVHADLVLTSPPYNLGSGPWPRLGHWKPGDSPDGKSKWRNGSDGGGGTQYANYLDAMPHPQYVAWQHSVLGLCWAALRETGAIFYNHKPRVVGAKLWLPLELNPGLPLRQIVIWARSGGMNFNPTAYVSTHEWLMIFAKPRFRLRDKGASGVGDVWTIPAESNTPHPAPFPLALAHRAIETTAPTLVLDPFAGWGTTLRAAKDVGCRSVGIEIEERYAELAAKRLHQEVLPLRYA